MLLDPRNLHGRSTVISSTHFPISHLGSTFSEPSSTFTQLRELLHQLLTHLRIHEFLSIHKLQRPVRLLGSMQNEHIVIVVSFAERERALCACLIHALLISSRSQHHVQMGCLQPRQPSKFLLKQPTLSSLPKYNASLNSNRTSIDQAMRWTHINLSEHWEHSSQVLQICFFGL